MYGHIHIVITSTQKVGNVIMAQEIYFAFGYTLWVGVINLTEIIGYIVLKYLA